MITVMWPNFKAPYKASHQAIANFSKLKAKVCCLYRHAGYCMSTGMLRSQIGGILLQCGKLKDTVQLPDMLCSSQCT